MFLSVTKKLQPAWEKLRKEQISILDSSSGSQLFQVEILQFNVLLEAFRIVVSFLGKCGLFPLIDDKNCWTMSNKCICLKLNHRLFYLYRLNSGLSNRKWKLYAGFWKNVGMPFWFWILNINFTLLSLINYTYWFL